MSDFTRRKFIGTGAAVAGAAALGGYSPLLAAQTPTLSYTPEPGAELRVLRWKRFVQGDEDQFLANIAAFTKKYGVPVRVDNEGWEDVRPKAAVSANVGSGPDIIMGWFDDPFQYPDKLLDTTELCTYLGNKYGGWYDVSKTYGTLDGKWISVPWAIIGNAIVYRDSQVKAAGFDGIPKDTDGFLKLCQAMKAKGTPPGFALGKAVGDGNNWVHWLLWSHGGMLVDAQGNVVVDSPEVVAALEYGAQLYKTFVPGTLSWQDPNNNKAFLDNQIGLTANGISVYVAAKNSDDPRLQAMAPDIEHAHFPIGPVGRPMELMQITQMMLFAYTKYPNASRELARWLMEADQYNPWLEKSIGYGAQTLKAYEANPIWKDPKATIYGEAPAYMTYHGYSGPLGTGSAGCLADYIVLDMVAEASSGSRTPKEAAARAAERAKRYYRS
jgi:multiple sugar transport system substrate-binding protein